MRLKSVCPKTSFWTIFIRGTLKRPVRSDDLRVQRFPRFISHNPLSSPNYVSELTISEESARGLLFHQITARLKVIIDIGARLVRPPFRHRNGAHGPFRRLT